MAIMRYILVLSVVLFYHTRAIGKDEAVACKLNDTTYITSDGVSLYVHTQERARPAFSYMMALAPGVNHLNCWAAVISNQCCAFVFMTRG